jgi:hypothetical protein
MAMACLVGVGCADGRHGGLPNPTRRGKVRCRLTAIAPHSGGGIGTGVNWMYVRGIPADGRAPLTKSNHEGSYEENF